MLAFISTANKTTISHPLLIYKIYFYIQEHNIELENNIIRKKCIYKLQKKSLYKIKRVRGYEQTSENISEPRIHYRFRNLRLYSTI
jgi:hypothetical protein